MKNVWEAVRKELRESSRSPLAGKMAASKEIIEFLRQNRVLWLAEVKNRRGRSGRARRAGLEDAAASLATDSLLARTLGTLLENGVDCLPVKGACFRYLLYDRPEQRQSVDLDILVRPEHYDCARRALEKAGYIYCPPSDDRQVTEGIMHEHGYRHPAFNIKGCLVELHRGFGYKDRYPVDVALIFERAMGVREFCKRVSLTPSNLPSLFAERGEAEDGGACGGVRFMTPEHALVHQFVHNASHNFNIPLISVVDAKLIIERWHPHWAEVIELARRWRLSAAGYFTLRIARYCLAAPVPEDVLKALEPSPLRKKWLETFIATEGTLVWPSSPTFPPVLGGGRRNASDVSPPQNCWGERRGAPLITFFRGPRNLRVQQALIGLPLIDGAANALGFAASYLKLRLADLAADLKEKI